MPGAIKQDSYMFELGRITKSSTADLEDYMIRISKLQYIGMNKLFLVRILHSTYPVVFPTTDTACVWLNTIVDTISKEDSVDRLGSLNLHPQIFAKVTQYIHLCNSV